MTRALGSRLVRNLGLAQLLILATLLFAAMAMPAWAHGDELHGDEPVAAHDMAGEMTAEMPTELTAEMMQEMASQEPPAFSLSKVLRNLHPATVHFAIALFVVAATTQVIAMRSPSRDLDAAIRIMVIAGGAGAVIAAVFGWIHTGLWFAGDITMQGHRWLGSILAVVGGGMAIAAWQKLGNPAVMKSLVIIMALAVLVQSFLGGELGHGVGHMFAGT